MAGDESLRLERRHPSSVRSACTLAVMLEEVYYETTILIEKYESFIVKAEREPEGGQASTEPRRFVVERTRTFYLASEDDANGWFGALPGWYWGRVQEDGSIGDRVGPFETEQAAEQDIQETIARNRNPSLDDTMATGSGPAWWLLGPLS